MFLSSCLHQRFSNNGVRPSRGTRCNAGGGASSKVSNKRGVQIDRVVGKTSEFNKRERGQSKRERGQSKRGKVGI